jgi:hypothetical protein
MLARLLWFLGAAVILVLAFFFLAAALVAGLVLGAGLLARVWWVSRGIRKAAEEQIISTEYAVIEREVGHEPLLTEKSDRQPESESRSRETPPGAPDSGSPQNDATAPGIPPARK